MKVQELSGNERKAAVESMFNSIAWRYDFLNHFLSLGIDRLWRRKTVRLIGKYQRPSTILDVATGTADLALAAMKLDPDKVTGIDISEKMLQIGMEKVKRKGLEGRIELLPGDSENIGFGDNTFDVAMVAFGVRNFGDPLRGLSEMRRVLRPGGLVMVLEFSRPASFPMRQLYYVYFNKILPFFGRLFSKDKSAYRYLPESVIRFPDNEGFMALLKEAGFTDPRQKRLSGGIASIYSGIKAVMQ
jgi:demethylmenaquinone methyltransferase / 2-methoxy-6-polyprenyl-1,4-benzoquinol methylase